MPRRRDPLLGRSARTMACPGACRRRRSRVEGRFDPRRRVKLRARQGPREEPARDIRLSARRSAAEAPRRRSRGLATTEHARAELLPRRRRHTRGEASGEMIRVIGRGKLAQCRHEQPARPIARAMGSRSAWRRRVEISPMIRRVISSRSPRVMRRCRGRPKCIGAPNRTDNGCRRGR
jgi:hypothetical protein